MAEMTDTELINYCNSHCETERALFHATQINRMLALAGYPKRFPRKIEAGRWLSLHGDMMELCELAIARMQLLASPPPDNVVPFRRKEHA